VPLIIEMGLELTGDGADVLLQRVSHMAREISTNMRVWVREDTLAREHVAAPTKQYGT
jgi:hypothetical protein